MKKIAVLLIILTVALCSCVSKPVTFPEKPYDADLEFWIGEDVTDVDFSEYQEVINPSGELYYLGKNYSSAPQYNVMYVIGRHGVYWEDGAYVSNIMITDPTIKVYGISCNSSFAQFDKAMKENGYVVEETANERPNTRLVKRDKAYISLYKSESLNYLTISLDDTN